MSAPGLVCFGLADGYTCFGAICGMWLHRFLFPSPLEAFFLYNLISVLSGNTTSANPW